MHTLSPFQRGLVKAKIGAFRTDIRSERAARNVHLPIIILTSLHPTLIADTAPKFDIARMCQSEGGSTEAQKRCADDETQARDTVQAEWTQFTPSAKKQCYEETNIDSTPSYVELLTCLEMERDVKTERGGKMSK